MSGSPGPTLLEITARHWIHFFMRTLHGTQTVRWPHGRNTTSAWASEQTMHSVSSPLHNDEADKSELQLCDNIKTCSQLTTNVTNLYTVWSWAQYYYWRRCIPISSYHSCDRNRDGFPWYQHLSSKFANFTNITSDLLTGREQQWTTM